MVLTIKLSQIKLSLISEQISYLNDRSVLGWFERCFDCFDSEFAGVDLGQPCGLHQGRQTWLRLPCLEPGDGPCEPFSNLWLFWICQSHSLNLMLGDRSATFFLQSTHLWIFLSTALSTKDSGSDFDFHNIQRNIWWWYENFSSTGKPCGVFFLSCRQHPLLSITGPQLDSQEKNPVDQSQEDKN